MVRRPKNDNSTSWTPRAAALALALAATAWTLPTAGQAETGSGADYIAAPGLTPERSLAGVWRLSAYEPRLMPLEGGEPPLTAAGLAAYRKNARLKRTEAGKNACVPFGTPRFYVSPWPIMILQLPGRVVIAHEENRELRTIRMDAEHFDPGPWDPSFVGEAVARWDGDVLVVDVLNFNGQTWLDDSGLPSSNRLHVVERWRRLDGGARLEVVFTIEDPVNYSRTWRARRVFEARPDLELEDDWVCGSVHRGLEGVANAGAVYVKPPTRLVTK